MDKQAVIQMSLAIIQAAENISVSGEHNRVQLSGIYRTATQIMAECGKEDEDDGG